MLNKAINLNKKFRGSYIDSAGVLHEDWYSAEDLISFFHANWPQIGIGKRVTTDLDGLFTFIGYDPASPPERAFDVDTRVDALENWKPDSTGVAIDAAVDKAPSAQDAESAPLVMQKAAVTYSTDQKITFTANADGDAGNDIDIVATCQLSATLGEGPTEITLVGATGLHSGSTPPLVSVQITQAATEAPLSITNTAGVIVIELPADGDDNPINVTMADLFLAIEAEAKSDGELDGVLAHVETGVNYDSDATAVVTPAIPFTAADNTVTEDGNVVTIWLANDGANFDNWDDVVTAVNADVNSTLVTASAGEESEAGPFEAITTKGGVDSRLCKAGQILYRTEGIIVCTEDTTAAETDTSKYMFFAKDAGQ